tara:strand:- start:92986 stop:94068 length:1083 start_codon:yes stop_codon:yes gene_type:complete
MTIRSPKLICSLVALACACTVSLAQDKTSALIDQLDSESWQERDVALIDLIDSDQLITLSDLERFIGDPDLSPEQRARLNMACLTRFASHPKGGLGVSFGDPRPDGVEVVPIANDPRFPASAMLVPGDTITMVGDQPVTTETDLRAHILSREPGDLLPVTILRGVHTLEMQLPLGAFTQLAGAARLDPIVAQRAIELRWDRLGIAYIKTSTNGSAINEDQWIAAAFPEDTTPDPRRGSNRLVPAMVAGAQQLVRSGQGRFRRTNLWSSRDLIHTRLVEIQIQRYDESTKRLTKQQDSIEAEAKVLEDRRTNAKSLDESKLIAQRIDHLRTELETIRVELAKNKAQRAMLIIQQRNSSGPE